MSIDSTQRITAQISWVYTHDLETTARFYGQALGLECVRDEGRARIFRVTGGAHIGICEAFADRVVEPQGGMISLVVENVDACYEDLVDRGVEIEAPPHCLEQFGIRTFFLRDPNGYVLEFQQFDSAPSDKQG